MPIELAATPAAHAAGDAGMLAELGAIAEQHRAVVSPGAELTDAQCVLHAELVAAAP